MASLADSKSSENENVEKESTFHDVEIEVTYSRAESRFSFSAFETVGDVIVTEDGDITIPYSGPVRLNFYLTAESGVKWEGIQLGWFGPTVTDTQGQSYEMPEHPDPMPSALSFRVRPSAASQGQTLIVEDLQDPLCEVLSYQLFVRDVLGGGFFHHDPKVYNKGNGGPWPEPTPARD